MDGISPCLWFDTEAEEAARFYTEVFPRSRIVDVQHYGSARPREEGLVMIVEFELDGRRFLALNGGPEFTFSEAVSFEILCESQEEVDRYWELLGEGGEHGPCGWLKDRFGVSWQVVPRRLNELVAGSDREQAQRVMAAMLGMRKLDVAALEAAAAGGATTGEGR